jgi:hypothetical protein
MVYFNYIIAVLFNHKVHKEKPQGSQRKNVPGILFNIVSFVTPFVHLAVKNNTKQIIHDSACTT